MKIGQLSKLTHVSARSIRHYEENGLLEAGRSDNDYREFDESAIERVQIIQLYLSFGFTVEEIRSLFNCEVAGPDDYEYCKEIVAVYEDSNRKETSSAQMR